MSRTDRDKCRSACSQKPSFPKSWINLPGLRHIRRRIGTFSTIRVALLRSLNADPILSDWTYRKADDPGIALLDGAAIIGDILAFYQELYANEAYLATAQWRESIADLVRLTGYRLSPGIGGRTTFALEIKGEKIVTVPKAFPIKAQLEGVKQPVDFATMQSFTAIPALSRFSLYHPFRHPVIGEGSSSFCIATATLEKKDIKLAKGDRLLLKSAGWGIAASGSDHFQPATVAESSTVLNWTEIRIDGGWRGSQATAIRAYKIKRSFRHFGSQGAESTVSVKDGQTTETPAKLTASATFISPFTSIYLDKESKEIGAGATVLITCKDNSGKRLVFKRIVSLVEAATTTVGTVSGSTTKITLQTGLVVGGLRATVDLKSLEVFEVEAPQLGLKSAAAADASADGSILYFDGEAEDYESLDSRRVLLADGTSLEKTSLVIDESAVGEGKPTELRPLYLNPPLKVFTPADFPLTDGEVDVYGNLVDADQGKWETEVALGDGDQRQAFQSFKIPKSPLTYLRHSGEDPARSPELQITVNDRIWTRVEDFFGTGETDEVYIVREDADGVSWVQFGDGKAGARPPSGVKNVKALYRSGSGAYGELKTGTKPQGGKLDGLEKIQMLAAAKGGAKPEAGTKAREAAPGRTQSLGRLVSLQDFECEALSISGMRRATAAWSVATSGAAVVVTVLMESGREDEYEQVASSLNEANRQRGPARFSIQVAAGKRAWVYLSARFGLQSSYLASEVKADITAALGAVDPAAEESDAPGLFGLDDRRFGQWEFTTRVAAVIQNTPGVAWAEVDILSWLGTGEDPSEITVGTPAATSPQAVVSCHADQILCLYQGHLKLEAVKDDARQRSG